MNVGIKKYEWYISEIKNLLSTAKYAQSGEIHFTVNYCKVVYLRWKNADNMGWKKHILESNTNQDIKS